MKQTKMNRTRNCRYLQPAYPNAADTNYFARRAAEILTAVLSGMGVVTAMTLLLVIA